MKSERRKDRIISVLKRRQPDLTIVLENIHDPHNVSAIFRSCDAVGVLSVNLLYYIEMFPKIGKKSSASAFKWIERKRFTAVGECLAELRKNGYKIFVASLCSSSKNLYDLDLTGRCALLFGNEHRGASPEAIDAADEAFYIPMYGMVQSLNVSVAAAVTLYEALRQRVSAGMYGRSRLNQSQLKSLISDWLKK